MFFLIYGAIRFYQDWLSTPISKACDYIDSIGAPFWWVLLVAAVIVWLMNRVAKIGGQTNGRS
ncbi:MAG: hypothetical protein ABIK28_05460 [Planctomycetota bacterium]